MSVDRNHVNAYLHTVSQLEPDLSPVDYTASLTSIAISLKRVAERLEGFNEITEVDVDEMAVTTKAYHAASREGLKRLLIPVEPELHKRLKMLAVQQDTTLEAIARAALADYVLSRATKNNP